ncbi:Glyoxalase/Bleomycin resistance protein/Dihydroxybiphenyl dioxygenase [Cadophora sp. MPI-SDFR-AT-0126]|nr:Glyoxalase/Bleomycin resistance protein/Dihydroxybiphenyl dioxygenase [Leotiomycetes sp. MPI-SDFR-AT-0126]
MTAFFDACGEVVTRPKYLAHVVLKTPTPASFKSMVSFYKTFLNATASYENEYLSFLTYDAEHHRIAIAIFPGTTERSGNSAGLAHVAFAFNSLHDLLLAYRQRKKHGISPFWSVNHGPTTSIYYKDPDGNEIETQVDNFDSNAEVDAFMTSPAFSSNPIGVDFDPEDLIQRLMRGESEADLKKRPESGSRTLT